MDKPAKPNWLMITIAAAFLLPPAYAIFDLLVDLGGQPPLIGVLGAGGVDCLMVMFGLWALQLGEEGVATWPANLGMVALACVSITAQIWHAILKGQVLTGVVLAALAVFGVLMIEGQLRRVHRINARRDHRIPMARPRPTLEQWIYFSRESAIATRLAVINPNTSADDVFQRAVEITTALDEPKPKQERGKLSLGASLPGLRLPRALGSGSNPDSRPDESGPVTEIGSWSGPVAALVSGMLAAGVTDDAAIVAGVLRINPEANPETIRRNVRTARSKTA